MLPDIIEINRYMRNLVNEVNPAIPLIIRGVQYPTNADDFLEFNTLLLDPQISRPGDTYSRVHFEIKCFSKHTNNRVDDSGVIDPHIPFSEPYAVLVTQKRYKIKTACLQLKEPKLVNLDLSSLGDFASGIDQQSPKLNLFCMVISIVGFVNHSTTE